MHLRPTTILLTAAVALAVVAAPAAATTTGGAQRVAATAMEPLPAADPDAVPADVAALRDDVLGPEWRDPDTIVLSWVGVSSFVAAVGGHVLLLDAWEIIGFTDDYLPLGREELAALQPEAVLVGHGHFDHAGDLGYVAGLSGALVVGAEEHCVVAEQGAVREGVGTAFTCAVLGTADSPPTGELQEVPLFADLSPVTVMRHPHSEATPPSQDNELDPRAPIFDPTPYLEHFADDPEELQRFIGQQTESNEGGAWLFHLALGELTLLWGNSSGPIFDDPAVTQALDSLPGCVDVMSNAILGFDQVVSGFQDPRLYVEAAHPKVFVPQHGDAWAPVISAGQAQYVEPVTAELQTLEHPPEIDFLLDPQDYLVPRAYDATDPRWATPPPGSSCAAAAGGEVEPAPDAPDDGDAAPGDTTDEQLPATGGGAALAAAGLLALAATGRRRRRALR